MISQIVPGGPAEDVGLRPEDLITGVDGRRIALRDELLGYIRSRAPGEAIFLTVIHPGELARTVRVRLDWLERRPLP